MEVVILQCQDNMSRCTCIFLFIAIEYSINYFLSFFKALPAIVQLIAQRFQRELITSELRLMLIQVFIVMLWLESRSIFSNIEYCCCQ